MLEDRRRLLRRRGACPPPPSTRSTRAHAWDPQEGRFSGRSPISRATFSRPSLDALHGLETCTFLLKPRLSPRRLSVQKFESLQKSALEFRGNCKTRRLRGRFARTSSTATNPAEGCRACL